MIFYANHLNRLGCRLSFQDGAEYVCPFLVIAVAGGCGSCAFPGPAMTQPLEVLESCPYWPSLKERVRVLLRGDIVGEDPQEALAALDRVERQISGKDREEQQRLGCLTVGKEETLTCPCFDDQENRCYSDCENPLDLKDLQRCPWFEDQPESEAVQH